MNEGLYNKYTVTKTSTGENVLNCFVLVPAKDPAARAALAAYAEHTDNAELARNLCDWLTRLKSDNHDLKPSPFCGRKVSIGKLGDGARAAKGGIIHG